MSAERTERVQVDDGPFEACVTVPDGGSGSGVLLLHEIFAIAESAKATAERWPRTLRFVARTLEG